MYFNPNVVLSKSTLSIQQNWIYTSIELVYTNNEIFVMANEPQVIKDFDVDDIVTDSME